MFMLTISLWYCHCYTNILLHWTTIISCTCITEYRYTVKPDCHLMHLYHRTQVLLHLTLLFLVHVPLIHYTLLHWILLHGYFIHSYFIFLYHCYIDSPVYMCWLFLYSCYIDHCLCYMDIHIFLLHDCFMLLISIWYSCYWAWVLLICDVLN